MSKTYTINKEQLEILYHTLNRSAKNRYCGDSEDMQVLCTKCLMKELGKSPLCSDKYFTITDEGRKFLSGIG